jgi:thiol-disulfide isomerase/thioredoxin
MSSITIGPFALPVSLVTLAVSVGSGWWVSELLARRRALAIESRLYLVLATGLLAARLVVVLSASRTAFGKPLLAGWTVAVGCWLAGMGLASGLQGSPRNLPAISLAALDGTSVNLAALQGRPVVLNLWASWCPPCRREMPVLQQAQQQRDDVQFVFVDQGETAAKVQAFLSANRLQLRNVLLDPQGQVALQFDQRAFPTTLFFDARGHLVATRVGELSTATLAERLDALVPHAPSHP